MLLKKVEHVSSHYSAIKLSIRWLAGYYEVVDMVKERRKLQMTFMRPDSTHCPLSLVALHPVVKIHAMMNPAAAKKSAMLFY